MTHAMNEMHSLGENFSAYNSCLDAAQKHGLTGVWATLYEEGYSHETDFVALLARLDPRPVCEVE